MMKDETELFAKLIAAGALGMFTGVSKLFNSFVLGAVVSILWLAAVMISFPSRKEK